MRGTLVKNVSLISIHLFKADLFFKAQLSFPLLPEPFPDHSRLPSSTEEALCDPGHVHTSASVLSILITSVCFPWEPVSKT